MLRVRVSNTLGFLACLIFCIVELISDPEVIQQIFALHFSKVCMDILLLLSIY